MIHIGDKQILPTVVIDVGRIHTHAGTRLSVVTEADFGLQGNLLKLPLARFVRAAIDEQKILHGIVRDK